MSLFPSSPGSHLSRSEDPDLLGFSPPSPHHHFAILADPNSLVLIARHIALLGRAGSAHEHSAASAVMLAPENCKALATHLAGLVLLIRHPARRLFFSQQSSTLIGLVQMVVRWMRVRSRPGMRKILRRNLECILKIRVLLIASRREQLRLRNLFVHVNVLSLLIVTWGPSGLCLRLRGLGFELHLLGLQGVSSLRLTYLKLDVVLAGLCHEVWAYASVLVGIKG